MSTAQNEFAAPQICESYEDRDGNTHYNYEGGLSAREHAAISLRVPDSGNGWLDAMIRTAQRNEYAARIMPSLIQGANKVSFGESNPENNTLYAGVALILADAMLAGAATPKGE